MMDVIKDTTFDTLKLIPFLFITFLLMEYIEHKFSKKSKKKLAKAGKFGPILGSLLGTFPQCGFSVMATNLYATRIITVGTLISIYLSTSDEMLPILISEGAKASVIFKILIIKIIIGMACGFIVDFILRKRGINKEYEIQDFCLEHHCDCKHSIFKSSLKHTLNITIFIIIVNLFLNIAISYLGYDKISTIFMKNSIFSPFIASFVGLIPNCAASVIITELYLNSVISFGSCVAGLLTGCGIGIVVLFKVNKSLRENLEIVGLLYLIGALSGVIINLLNLL